MNDMTNAVRWPSSTSNVGNSIERRDQIDDQENDDDDAAVATEPGEPERPPEQTARRKICCTSFSTRFPRLFAILFGIHIPIFVLVLLSCVFGYWIAHIESPVEIEQNDNRIASYAITTRKLQILSNLTSVSPKICFNLFLNNVTIETLMSSSLLDILYEGIEDEPSPSTLNSTATVDDDSTPIEILHQIKSRYESIADDTVPEIYNSSKLVDAELNIIDLYNFLQVCGDKFRSFIYNETGLTILPLAEESTSYSMTALPVLSFSWNRCTPLQFSRQPDFMLSLHPINQTQYYITAWENDTMRLFDYYYNYYTTTWNVSTDIAFALAEQQSVVEATGKAACVVNTFSGAWFWFTIMSTIGYGNASVETTYGRTLIYTFGFFSILGFGGISLGAGAVTVAIFKDTCIRCNVAFLTTPWLASLIWGSLYYTWMCVIANNYADWNAERLSTSNVTFRDGFWFAYISTTSIGLGDFILNPAVIIASDMVFWPFIFLLGFVLFSAFICNLSAVVMKPLHDSTKHLSQRLEETNMFFGKPMRKRDNDNQEITDQNTRQTNVEEFALNSFESRVPTPLQSDETLNEKERVYQKDS